MKFKAILIGALVTPPSFGRQSSSPVPSQRFATSKAEARAFGLAVLESLEPDVRAGALVQVIEITEVIIEELR